LDTKRNSYAQLQKSHPCFGEHAANTGRIHLPVSPGCNIACRFCNRSINDTENRPGVTSEVLTPEESLDVLARALELCPQIKVAGIAGPGDTLATDGAVHTLRLVKERYPELLRCLSTNGLLLYERAEELLEVGVDTLTVTVNAVDPAIEAKLNKYIIYHGVKYEGEEGARILIENQLKGIRRMADAGVTVKVNTVLVPEINADHVEDIALAIAEAGASIYNLIPLIPQFELSGYRAPDCRELNEARMRAGKYMDIFRHCQHCRADAIGVPGVSEFGDQIYRRGLNLEENFSHG
jgi:nitrogen fixation protein NifB